jgi:hypothetical protein
VVMSNEEAIAAVKAGGRCQTEHAVLGLDEQTRADAMCVHSWRVVACDSDTDVLECSRCGRQKLVPCSFDDDMA